MRIYRGADGSRRVWYQEEEIETITEQELQRAGLYPTSECWAVDVERFVERHLRVRLDRHADLGADLLGVTEFFGSTPPIISVNRDLTTASVDTEVTSPRLLGRWRATVAHEAAHVVLHRVLYDVHPGQGELFASADLGTERTVRCNKSSVTFQVGAYDWREVQANRGMASLLMPVAAFRSAVGADLAAHGTTLRVLATEPSAAASVAASLSRQFEVSRQACGIRLSTLGYVEPTGLLALD